MMRYLLLLALASALVAPVAVEAQPRLLVGGGITAPNGDISDFAETGYHAQVGIEIGIPTLPLAFRADGGYHKLSASDGAYDDTKILGGSLSVVYKLPGVGLSPYFLGGVGSYRTEAGLAGATETATDTGYHGGFGMNIGAVGFGAFVEIRFVRISGANRTTRFIPVTFGLRL